MQTPRAHHEIEVKFNPAAAFEALKLHLSRVLINVKIGLTASHLLVDGPLAVPGSFLQFELGPKSSSSSEDSRAEFRRWLVGLGLREAVDAVSTYTEYFWELLLIQDLLAAGRLQLTRSVVGTDGLHDYLKEQVRPRLRRFAGAGLRRKLELFKTSYGIAPHGSAEVISINKARTCLTHRLGVVAREDVNDDQSQYLRVLYTRSVFEITDAHGRVEEITRPGQSFEQGGELSLRFVSAEAGAFPIGARVEFNVEDFTHLLLTCFNFCQDLGRLVEGLLRERLEATPSGDTDKADQ